jgi:hypothetical protein
LQRVDPEAAPEALHTGEPDPQQLHVLAVEHEQPGALEDLS